MNLSNVKNLITKRNLSLLSAIFVLSITLAFGLGYTLAKNDNPTPIIINQN